MRFILGCAPRSPVALLAAIDAINAQNQATRRQTGNARAGTLSGDGATAAGARRRSADRVVLRVDARVARAICARGAGPYLGLVSRRDQSGESDKQLGITKAGHVQMRCLLVNCAHYILGPFGPTSRLRAAGER